MKEINNITELQSVLMDIALEFHRICVKHNIPYFMVGGTLLGAIRHGGFIPWDDDMDFCVPRGRFAELKQVLSAELKNPYRLLTIDNYDGLVRDFIKIDDSRTYVKSHWKESMKDEAGVNIDIFPLDETDGNTSFFSKNNIGWKLVQLDSYRLLSPDSRPFFKKMVAYMIKLIMLPFRKTFIDEFVEKRLSSKGDFLINRYGVYGLREIVRKELFGKPVLYKFGEHQLYGVEQPDAYLTRIYGDYMKLPPVEKRGCHITDMYWK